MEKQGGAGGGVGAGEGGGGEEEGRPWRVVRRGWMGEGEGWKGEEEGGFGWILRGGEKVVWCGGVGGVRCGGGEVENGEGCGLGVGRE